MSFHSVNSCQALLRGSFVLCLLGALNIAGCADEVLDQESLGVGSLVLPLVSATPAGTSYRLRATFLVTGTGVTRMLDGTSATEPTVATSLPQSSYSVAVQPDWALVRLEGGVETPVTARLLNPSSSVLVVTDQTTRIVFRFDVRGGVVELGSGDLEIGFEVQDRHCSNDGLPCQADGDCSAAPLQGTCAAFGALGNAPRQCVFPAFNSGNTVCNEGKPGDTDVTICRTDASCSLGLTCRLPPAGFCRDFIEENVPGAGVCGLGTQTSCVANAECILTAPNRCLMR